MQISINETTNVTPIKKELKRNMNDSLTRSNLFKRRRQGAVERGGY